MKFAQILFLLGIAHSLVGPVAADEEEAPRTRVNAQFGDFKGDGYYWYRQDPLPVKPKPVIPKPAQPSAPAKPEDSPLSTAWLRANMPKLLEAANDNPTKENVANYMYAQRVLLDKAQIFSEQVKSVVASDPFLDENNRVPIAQFAQPAFMRGVKQGQDDVLNYLGQKSGIWVFVDEPAKCSACASYVSDILEGTPAVKGVAAMYNFNLRKINVNTDAGRIAAKKLNLKVTPTTVLVIPPQGFFLVSQGLMSQGQLSERLLIAANASGVLPRELAEKVNPFAKGLLSTEMMNSMTPGEKPADVMKHLRERIKVDQQ